MKRGDSWESVLIAWHALYLRRGAAWVVKCNPPVTVTRKSRGGLIEGYMKDTGPPDFGGCIAGGQAVCFEAKHVVDPGRFPLANLKRHQVEHLDAAAEMGAVCFLALRMGSRNYAVPWGPVSHCWHLWADQRRGGRVKRGTASMFREGLEGIGAVEMGPEGWLPVVLGWPEPGRWLVEIGDPRWNDCNHASNTEER